jgi:hypothetical protein
MEVQDTKKHLAGVLLAPHDGGRTDDSLSGLHVGDAIRIFLRVLNAYRNCDHYYEVQRHLQMVCKTAAHELVVLHYL